MINAKIAKKQSEINAVIKLKNRKKQQFAYIEKLIRESIKEGRTYVIYRLDVFDEVAEKLHNAGYSITKTFYEKSDYIDYITISWSELR